MNKIIKGRIILTALLSLLVFCSAYLLVAQKADAAYTNSQGIRVNQVGYITGESKIALVITSTSLTGQTFSLKSGTSVVYTGTVGKDRGAYAQNSHLYELDFSSYDTDGTYTLTVGSYTSPSFKIGKGLAVYSFLLNPTMHYFRYQRCGNPTGAEGGSGSCHLNDSNANGGPQNGQHVDVAGGWHDADNHPKLITTFGYAVMQMMIAYDRFSASGIYNGMTYPVLDETKVGLDWIYKMWDPTHNVLYAQVGPGDTDRTALALDLQPGTGANIAGRAAAALAMGSYVWKNSDPTLSAKWLTAAKQIYAYGKTRQATWIDPWGYYPESSKKTTGWKDDMALGAVELFRATGDTAYRDDAINTYLPGTNAEASEDTLNPSHSIAWWDVTAMANYEMGRVYPTYKTTAVNFLKDVVSKYYNDTYFDTGLQQAEWGTVELLTNRAITESFYEDLSGDLSMHNKAVFERDYIFGRNPWGYSYVAGAGTYNTVMNGSPTRPGWWGEGPTSVAILNDVGIGSSLGSFDTSNWWYLNDSNNYVVNEHTVTANSAGLALVSWLTQLGSSTTPPPPPPTTKTGDLNNDNKVDIFDYNILISNFGKTGTGISGDIDKNSKVDIFDYNLLVGNFGK